MRKKTLHSKVFLNFTRQGAVYFKTHWGAFPCNVFFIILHTTYKTLPAVAFPPNLLGGRAGRGAWGHFFLCTYTSMHACMKLNVHARMRRHRHSNRCIQEIVYVAPMGSGKKENARFLRWDRNPGSKLLQILVLKRGSENGRKFKPNAVSTHCR